MEDDVIQRIASIISYKSKNEKDFANIIGIAQTSLNNYMTGRRKISFDVIKKISTSFGDISSDWLITGQGEMLKPVTSSAPGSIAIGGNASGVVNNGYVTGSIQGHSVKNGNVVGDHNNIGIMPSDCERALIKAKVEIDILKKKVKESENKSKNRIEEITRQYDQEKESLKNQLEQAVEERNRSLVDKDRALAMLEKALSK